MTEQAGLLRAVAVHCGVVQVSAIQENNFNLCPHHYLGRPLKQIERALEKAQKTLVAVQARIGSLEREYVEALRKGKEVYGEGTQVSDLQGA